MITLSQMAEELQMALNKALRSDPIAEYPMNPDNSEWYITIAADTADYKPAEASRNQATWYIQGLLTQTGATLEGAEAGARAASVDTLLTLTVKVLPGVDQEGKKQIVNAARNALTAALDTNQYGYAYETDGTAWVYGVEYTLLASGERYIAPMIGDAYTFTAGITWHFAESAINSRDITITVDKVQLYPTQIGIIRTTSSEKAVPSNQGGYGAKNFPQSTDLAISISAPAFTNILDVALPYIVTGLVDPLSVTLQVNRGTQQGEQRTYTMVIASASLNGEGNLTASASITFVERENVTNGG